MKRGWFGPKRVGWGAAPRSWEGWAVVAVMLAVLAVYTRFLGPVVAEALGVARPIATLGGSIIWIGVLLLIVRATYSDDA